MKMKRILLLIVLLLLVGCDMSPDIDRKLQREIFFECLKNAPKQPDNSKYNDSAEIIHACGEQARDMALKD